MTGLLCASLVEVAYFAIRALGLVWLHVRFSAGGEGWSAWVSTAIELINADADAGRRPLSTTSADMLCVVFLQVGCGGKFIHFCVYEPEPDLGSPCPGVQGPSVFYIMIRKAVLPFGPGRW